MTDNIESGIVEIDVDTEVIDADVTTTTNEKRMVSHEPIKRIINSVQADIVIINRKRPIENQAESIKRRYRIGVFSGYIRNIHRFPLQETVARFRR